VEEDCSENILRDTSVSDLHLRGAILRGKSGGDGVRMVNVVWAYHMPLIRRIISLEQSSLRRVLLDLELLFDRSRFRLKDCQCLLELAPISALKRRDEDTPSPSCRVDSASALRPLAPRTTRNA